MQICNYNLAARLYSNNNKEEEENNWKCKCEISTKDEMCTLIDWFLTVQKIKINKQTIKKK